MKKIEEIREEFETLSEKLSHPEKINSGEEFGRLSQRRERLREVVEKDDALKEIERKAEENKKLRGQEKDKELIKLIEEEEEKLKKEKENLEEDLKRNLISLEEESKGEREGSERNSVILEIRAGAGGDEASLFAEDLFNMYSKFAQQKSWDSKILDFNKSDLGGYKNITFKIKGKEAYLNLKHEGGVHRVQRVPSTEKGGRIHTSTVSVAVLPEAKKGKIKIKPDEIRVDTFRSSGPGGQYVNKRDSAVRITHLPTGIMVASQNERSQAQNKETALSILHSKLLQKEIEEQEKEMRKERKSQVGEAMRSEKIRTYNFLQDRVTDHRIEKSWHNLEEILAGNLFKIIDALKKEEERQKYQNILG